MHPWRSTRVSDDPTFYIFLLAPPLAGEAILLLFLFRFWRNRQTKTGWKQVLLVNTLSCFVLVALAGGGGELYYRYLYDTTDALGYTKVSQQWVKRYFRNNSSGFRDNIDYPRRRTAGVRRITFLGDSFTAGHGIKSVEDRFANLIRARHPEWEVHLFAGFGFDTGLELDLLKKGQGLGYEYDEVVLVYCLNDIGDLSPEWNRQIEDVFADADRGGWLRRNSFFLDLLYHRYKAAHDPRMSQYFTFVRQCYEGPLWQIQKARLESIRNFVASVGGRLSVVTFPFLQLEGKDYEYRPVHQQLDQFWLGLGVPHLDLHSLFENEPRARIVLHRYDAHPSEYAHRLAAEKIDQFLLGHPDQSPAPVR